MLELLYALYALKNYKLLDTWRPARDILISCWLQMIYIMIISCAVRANFQKLIVQFVKHYMQLQSCCSLSIYRDAFIIARIVTMMQCDGTLVICNYASLYSMAFLRVDETRAVLLRRLYRRLDRIEDCHCTEEGRDHTGVQSAHWTFRWYQTQTVRVVSTDDWMTGNNTVKTLRFCLLTVSCCSELRLCELVRGNLSNKPFGLIRSKSHLSPRTSKPALLQS